MPETAGQNSVVCDIFMARLSLPTWEAAATVSLGCKREGSLNPCDIIDSGSGGHLKRWEIFRSNTPVVCFCLPSLYDTVFQCEFCEGMYVHCTCFAAFAHVWMLLPSVSNFFLTSTNGTDYVYI